MQLVLAHILGDFVIQPDDWIEDKKKKKHKSRKLYWHTAIHAIALLFTLQFDLQYWIGILFIVVTHYLIDLGKLYANEKVNERWLFLIDQALHLLIIGVTVYFYAPFSVEFKEAYTPEALLLIVFLLLKTFVSSIFLKVLVSKWKPEKKGNEELKNAGAYIGMLERLFIFGFILIDYWEGIGFLLAAKSVFRFGDLSNTEDRNLTEYILIGTLLSFGIAILISKGYQYLEKALIHQ
ncbi:DUF3307 domain-containing protein [Algoriphagus hitonicola]|uniref:DUF3307 domain-containing protein n=1 Tax=Algoriphagus hitonicola TaxID=435880 RepID=A0A1I2P965_9BACT|nr:DUF3307 domain-containing protein [Algoriphagus hitonicola]SFG12688.1 Protein of unknown function [Algoriphagus hitonicola]